MNTSSRALKQIAYQQSKEFLLITLYLWVVLGLLVMFKSVVLGEQHIPFQYHGFAIINALALAKVMLTAKDLHLGERFDDAPLIYPTLLKSALFSVVLACFKILEEAAIGLYHHQSAEHCRYRRRHLECDSYFDASVVRRAHPFRRIPGTAKGSWSREIGADLFPPASATLGSVPGHHLDWNRRIVR